MSAVASSTNRPSGDASFCIPCLLSVWLIVQLCALGMGAAGLAWSSHWPRPAHQLALHEMLAVQVVVSSLLFPWLMRSWRTSLIVIVTSWPMGILAAALAENSDRSLLAGTAYVTTWLATLGVWSRLLQSHYLQLIGVLVAGLATLGGAVLWYISREFGNAIPLLTGALIGAMVQIEQPFGEPVAWAMVIGPLIVGTSAVRISKPQAA